VYNVQYTAHSIHSKRTSGLNGAYGSGAGGGPAVSSGSATAAVAGDSDDAGVLAIDVVAATADSGLVVDVTYTGRNTSQPTTRVALFADGRMSADPAKPLGPPALHLLPLLARGFIANRIVEPGATWDVPQTPPMRGKTTYTVSRYDGTRATIALDGSMTVPGASGFEETDRGTTTYETDLINPVAFDVTIKIWKPVAMDEEITTNARLVATLVKDSFAK
jgi:hypothetical protein